VRADTLSNCISVNHGLTLESGQGIPFEKMQRFEVLSAEQLYAPNAKATLTITLLDGTQMRGISVAANCDLFGYNDPGRFATHLQDLRRVEFQR
jgi:hypothetical protein